MTSPLRQLACGAALAVTLCASPLASGQGFGERSDETTDDSGLLDGVLPVPGVWTGSLGLGATRSTGTSKSSSINGSFRLLGDFERWEHLLRASALKSSQTVLVERRGPDGELQLGPEGETLRREETRDGDDRLTASYSPRRFFSESLYGFALIDYERDEPANIERGLRNVVGAGYRVFETDLSALSFELGAGYKNTTLVDGDDIDGGILYLGANWYGRVSDVFDLTADLRADVGDDNTFYELALGAGVDLTSILSLELAHFVRGNTDVEPAPESFDEDVSNTTTLSLVLEL